MNASEVGSKDWWAVIKDMPAEEAIEYLREYKASLLEKNQGQHTQLGMQVLLQRLNSEMKLINMRIARSEWRDACRKVLPPEMYEAVCVERLRMEQERMK